MVNRFRFDLVRRGEPCLAARCFAALSMTSLGALALILVVASTGCRSAHTRLTIRGGPSLDALFSDLARAYEAANPGANVVCDFTCPPCVLFKRPGGLGDFDLFASFGQFELDQLSQHGQLSFAETTPIGTASLSLVVPARSSTKIKSLADLHRGVLRRIGVGDPQTVGVGYYTQQALSKAGLWGELEKHFVYSQSGCELLKWLGLGRDIDAAIVFSVCSTAEQGSVREALAFPAELIPPVPLLLARPRTTAHLAEARRFTAFVLSEAARPVLLRHRVGVSAPQ